MAVARDLVEGWANDGFFFLLISPWKVLMSNTEMTYVMILYLDFLALHRFHMGLKLHSLT